MDVFMAARFFLSVSQPPPIGLHKTLENSLEKPAALAHDEILRFAFFGNCATIAIPLLHSTWAVGCSCRGGLFHHAVDRRKFLARFRRIVCTVAASRLLAFSAGIGADPACFESHAATFECH